MDVTPYRRALSFYLTAQRKLASGKLLSRQCRLSCLGAEAGVRLAAARCGISSDTADIQMKQCRSQVQAERDRVHRS